MNSKIFDKTFLKFIGVGVVNTVVGTGVMFFLYNILNCNYWISSSANYIIGSIVSYFLNKYFTFRSEEKGWKVLIRFVVNITVCYIIAYGIAKPLASLLLNGMGKSIQENGAMFTGMILFMLINYLGQRYFTFKV